MVFLLDIDRFKWLNDSRGYEAGDIVLAAMAERVRDSVRASDTVARVGDDEFGVIVDLAESQHDSAAFRAELIAEKIRAELAQPYPLAVTGEDYQCSVSIGISLFLGEATAPDELVKQAEVALNQAKHDGRNTIRFFDPAMQALVEAQAAMEHRLRGALLSEGLQLYLQSQVDDCGRILGAEALLRWQDPNGTMIPPSVFIPLAEQTGLIIPIGRWVLETACRQLAYWQHLGPPFSDFYLAVNISAKQFQRADFGAEVERILQETGAAPGHLKLELTESAILGDIDETVSRMRAIRKLGVQFSLDDFGTGYSSFSYLKRLPLDQLKIDQSFVHDLASEQSRSAIVKAILALSAALDLDVVAEGVETENQYALLKEYGCGKFQGYRFGYPLPLDAWAASVQEQGAGNRGCASAYTPLRVSGEIRPD